MEESTYYLWQPPESERAVHLSFDVIDRILQDVLRGFALVPKRGAEVGGILLGKIEGSVVKIDDFVAIPCDYRKGPSYLLTENDGQAFQDAWVRAGKRAVGYYRSDTRAAMTIAPEDRQLITRHFPDPATTVLLIRPFATKVSHAGFFFREDGRFPEQTPLGFSFSRKLLGGGTRPRTIPAARPVESTTPVVSEAHPEQPRAIESHSTLPNPAIAAERPPRTQKPQSSGKDLWIATIALCVALGWGGGYYTARKITPPIDPKAFQLSLTATPQTNSIRISWNTNAQAIRSAVKGKLLLRGDELEKPIPLSIEQLRLGHTVFVTTLSSITADLEIEESVGSFVKESIRFTPPASPESEKKPGG